MIGDEIEFDVSLIESGRSIDGSTTLLFGGPETLVINLGCPRNYSNICVITNSYDFNLIIADGAG